MELAPRRELNGTMGVYIYPGSIVPSILNLSRWVGVKRQNAGGGQREHAPGDDNHRPVNGGRVPLQWSSPLVRPTLLSFNKLLTHRSELIRISRFAKRMDEHEFQLVSLFRVKMMKRSRGSVFARVFVFFIIRCCV